MYLIDWMKNGSKAIMTFSSGNLAKYYLDSYERKKEKTNKNEIF